MKWYSILYHFEITLFQTFKNQIKYFKSRNFREFWLFSQKFMPLEILKVCICESLCSRNISISERGIEIIESGCRASGILGALRMGSSALPSIDPFANIADVTCPNA